MNARRVALSVALAVASTALVSPASAASAAPAAAFRAIDLGTLGGNASQAIAVNNHDQVVGISRLASGLDHPFLWSRGRMVDLGALEPGMSAGAIDVNDAGDVVGTSLIAAPGGGTLLRAVLWHNGNRIALGTLGGDNSQAMSINNRGEIVGNSETAAGVWHAFIWRHGVMTDLSLAQPWDNNDRGDIVGSGYQIIGGHVTMLSDRDATAINNAGWIAGIDAPAGFARAIVWRGDTRIVLAPDEQFTSAVALNDRRQIIGIRAYFVPFLWDNGTFIDLTTRGVAADATVHDINNHTHLAATVYDASVPEWRAVLYV